MSKKYSIIYSDPPWQFNSVKSGGSMKSGAAAKYDVMTLDQLKALDVPALCEKDCVLVMWYVSSQPQEALDLVKAWGFTLKNMNAFIWRKLSTNLIPHFGMGYWTRAGAECALIAVRGKPKAECRSIRQVRDEVVGEHSEKPAIFRDDIVKLCGDVPRLEMFARVAAPGWDVFGNEVDNSVHINGSEQTCHSETAESETQPALTAESETQTKAPELITLEFTRDELEAQIESGKLPFSGDALDLILQLEKMFGKKAKFTSKQVKAAIIAFDDPDMISKNSLVDKEPSPSGPLNPFFSGFHNEKPFYTVDAKDRVAKVQHFTLEQCHTALKVNGLQSTVIKAIEVRIRKLNKQEQAA
ncbi:MT-A70 family methyltransferase [Arsukibacterium indicum]|uniref:Adenine methyltransferase n=1 Tax=Arsukibacterium indicum TaxID=2848612 RepID=A0ABS6MHC1_9GAMM|nr:MT-A70 family methyltransferase [Arsukibacterium indicum]MBV2128199.1 hypothetical protein [Arsukibacterium indicum]